MPGKFEKILQILRPTRKPENRYIPSCDYCGISGDIRATPSMHNPLPGHETGYICEECYEKFGLESWPCFDDLPDAE